MEVLPGLEETTRQLFRSQRRSGQRHRKRLWAMATCGIVCIGHHELKSVNRRVESPSGSLEPES